MSTLELFRALKWAQTEATGECCVDITRQLQRHPSLMTQNLVACKKQKVDVPIDRHLIINSILTELLVIKTKDDLVVLSTTFSIGNKEGRIMMTFLYKTFKNLVSWFRHLNFWKDYFLDFLGGLHP